METINFNVLRTANYDTILGMPWLVKHNPTIYWQTKEGKNDIEFNTCKCNWDPEGLPNLLATQHWSFATQQ